MVFKRTSMKRKRKVGCTSPLLEETPKRTKVHAQRKFAQGSNINSPVITPIKELEDEIPKIDVLPEPVELLPIKRPNTEDFLTFLCFRGTPILPPSLNFFNTASIVDTNGQVHEIKSESPKNGPIDIAKCGSSSEKPFIAFGVRKRADPIVISRQMDRKRRHALALQALRRKYQEQKMAKIRALTISKLSEKVTNKTLVRTNTVSKTETVTKKSNTLQKTKVVATKHVKVTTQTLKTTLRPKIKPKMCLRSFRGRFVQKELPFRKRVVSEKKIIKKPLVKKIETKKKKEVECDFASEDEEPLSIPAKEGNSKSPAPKVVKKTAVDPSPRITRSGHNMSNSKIHVRRQQIKKIILLSAPNTIIKPRSLRSTTMKKSVLSQRKSKSLQAKQKLKTQQRLKHFVGNKSPKNEEIKSSETLKLAANTKKEIKPADKKNIVKTTDLKKENKSTNLKKNIEIKKECNKTNENDKKVGKTVDAKKEVKKSIDIKNEISKTIDIKKGNNKSDKNDTSSFKNISKELVKTCELRKDLKHIEIPLDRSCDIRKDLSTSVEKNKKEINKSSENSKKQINKLVDNKKLSTTSVVDKSAKKVIETIETETDKVTEKPKKINKNDKQASSKKEDSTKKDLPDVVKKDVNIIKKGIQKSSDVSMKKDVLNKRDTTNDSIVKKELSKSNIYKCKKELSRKEDTVIKKEDVIKKKSPEALDEDQVIPKTAQRPSRKTKEAAAIYMEILSHKLVNDSIIDDDNISIDSFPELPNVKKTEQRENELKAQAKSSKDDNKEKSKVGYEIETDNKNIGTNLLAEDNSSKYIKAKSNSSIVSPKKNVEEKRIVEKQKIKKISENTAVEDIESKKSSKTEIASRFKEKTPDSVNLDQHRQSQTEHETEAKVILKKQPVTLSELKKIHISKRRPVNEVSLTYDTDSEDNIKRPKVKKSESNDLSEPKDVNDVNKRQTRNSSQAYKKDYTDDSDESFHIDIKIPRKKKLTRSKVQKTAKNESITEKPESVTKSITTNTKTDLKSKETCQSSTDSDHSTTSDVNLQTLVNKAKNKKFSKTKSMKKPETAFSDSDEAPLSRLTNKSIEGSQKSAIPSEQIKEKPKQDVIKNITKFVPKNKTNKAPAKPDVILEPETTKPKRECAKRPQNYLPMLSSSDEDDIFHGFDEKIEEKCNKPIPIAEPSCSHAPPLLDLLSKDVGRRFGKEKVNMSNEQIEKWLKDSALAGSSIKKENDEMLKFGERIPTETTLEALEHIDTQNLKASLLEVHVSKKETDEGTSTTEDPISPVKIEKQDLQSSNHAKPQMIDRKLIFRKSRKDSAPNVNAFSPENESSVYAFGEENEDVISTPFRRPSRRPSSTATSRSEDESSKHDDSLKAGHFRKPSIKQDVAKGMKDESDPNVDTDESSHHFYIPQKPSKHNFSKLQSGSNLQKAKNEYKTVLKPSKTSDRLFESDDFKYKIPSSPSASSSSSAKLYKRQTQKQKVRPPEFISPIYVSDFPKKTDAAKVVEAPVFHPTDQEFQDPLEYIERIRHKAEQFGICRIVPPSSFKPECKVTDDMRFTAYNQYVHKMLHRWGPNFKELMAIKKYLETQNISFTHPPWIGGMEIDLPRLYQTVQSLGGLKEVIEKKKWPRVSELMKIPKSAQDRVTKLDDIYCKYLLPYDTLSPAEREKLFDEVETEWAKRESKSLLKAQQKLASPDSGAEGDSEPDDNDIEECITKGRNIALNAFYRIARNTMSMYFKTAEPTAQEVEQEYWKHVTLRQNHICVHSGSIDSGNWGYGFAVTKNSPFARHPWNLKVLTNNSGSVLRSLGPIMGVTVPTLHVGMVFSACCWYRDPHGLPWIEYLHTGGNKIWYGIPNSASDMFHASLKKQVPNYCKNKELWLPSDTVMVPPGLLVENNVSLCRTVQDPGQFVVVFPKTFTSSISTGYVVSESVYFAPPYWLRTARNLFDNLKNSREPSMFSLDRLLLSIASDARCSSEILKQVTLHIQELCDKEKARRNKLNSFGSMELERMPLPEANNRKRKKLQGEEGDYECEICRMNLFVSMVFDTQEAVTYCLDHAIEMIENKKSQISNCKFMFTYDDKELAALPNKINMAVENKLQKRIPNKYAGMPTLLNK